MSKTKPLPYAVYKIDSAPKPKNRIHVDARILLADNVANGKIVERTSETIPSKEELAATVVAAAKYIVKTTNADIVSVVLDSQNPVTPYGNSILAHFTYAPDGEGITGKQGWKYDMMDVQPRGLSQQELQIQRLWGLMRDDFQVKKEWGLETDEQALSNAIAKKLNIKPEDVKLVYFMPEKIPVKFIEMVEAKKTKQLT